VQVAYPNYPCTTGCKEIDFFISDRWTTPDEGFERQYSEKEVYRIPSGYVIYMPPENTPGISELPARRNGYVTFGLFQRAVKYSESLWDAIAEILRRTPRSRLLVQHASRDLDEPGTWIRNLITDALGDRGIEAERIDFVGTKGVHEHLEVVSRVDIALDSFHYSGQTTTCASLWMGVPVVSLGGDCHASRVGYALLSRIGLSDWAATSLEEYIQIGVSKARDVEGMDALRAGLRERMARSSVCRPEIVVREIEDGYRWMWRRWCAAKMGKTSSQM
jgi:protein O-GlcNAc transferase